MNRKILLFAFWVSLAGWSPLHSSSAGLDALRQFLDERGDPYLAMQWVLRSHPVVAPFARTLTDASGQTWYYLPKSFWERDDWYADAKNVIRERFVSLFYPWAMWHEQIFPVDRFVFLQKAGRESAYATSRLAALSHGNIFAIKVDPTWCSYYNIDTINSVVFFDDAPNDRFLSVRSTDEAFRLFGLAVTKDHYLLRYNDGGWRFLPTLIRFRQGFFYTPHNQLVYPAEDILWTLCGWPDRNWATNCTYESDLRWLNEMRFFAESLGLRNEYRQMFGL